MKSLLELQAPDAIETAQVARAYGQYLALAPDSDETKTKKTELFVKLDNLTASIIVDKNNSSCFRDILCAPDLLPNNSHSKQTASIDLFLEYINEPGKDFRLETFLRNCPEDKLEFWAKVKLKEAYILISSRAETTKNFLKLEALINVIEKQKNEKLLHIVIDSLFDIIKNVKFLMHDHTITPIYEHISFKEFCRYRIITIVESLKNPTSKVIPILYALISTKKSNHAQKAQELLFSLIAKNPALLVIDINGTKKLSLVNKYYDANGKRIYIYHSSDQDTKAVIKQALTHSAIQYLESQTEALESETERVIILSDDISDLEPQEPGLNILNQALADAIHDENLGAIEALFEAKSSTNWSDKQQFIHLLCSRRLLGFKGLERYLELEFKNSPLVDCSNIENFLKQISDEATQILAIENLLQITTGRKIEDFKIQAFEFLAKNPKLCQKIKFEKLKISIEIEVFDTAKKFSALIWDHKNTAILLPLLKLLHSGSIKSEPLNRNLATIIRKTTAENGDELDKIISYLESVSKELYFTERWDNPESNTLYKLKPDDYRGLFWRPSFFESSPANKITFDEPDNDEGSTLIESEGAASKDIKAKRRARPCNCAIS